MQRRDGLVTIDSNTGLVWLDLTATLGSSWNQAVASIYVQDHGFTHVTAAQVETLFLSAGFLTTDDANDPLNDGAALGLVTLMGCTQLCDTNFVTGLGFADNSDPWTTRPNHHEGPLGGGASSGPGTLGAIRPVFEAEGRHGDPPGYLRSLEGL